MKSTTPFPLCSLFCNFSNHRDTFDFSCDHGCTASLRAGSHFDISISLSINISIGKITKNMCEPRLHKHKHEHKHKHREWNFFSIFLFLCLCLCLCFCFKFEVLFIHKYIAVKSECPLKPSHIENMWHMMKNQNFSYSSQR